MIPYYLNNRSKQCAVVLQDIMYLHQIKIMLIDCNKYVPISEQAQTNICTSSGKQQTAVIYILVYCYLFQVKKSSQTLKLQQVILNSYSNYEVHFNAHDSRNCLLCWLRKSAIIKCHRFSTPNLSTSTNLSTS